MSKSKKVQRYQIDKHLVSIGLALDVADARALIMAGQVLVDEQRIDKPGFMIKQGQSLRLKDLKRFVSRGGEKLWGAIEDLKIAGLVAGATVLDCGASTGGFTDCVLQLGAKKVYALEIGFNQLAWKLRTNSQVVVMESTDIRLVAKIIDEFINLVVADISFNSLDRLLPAICKAVPAENVFFLLLIKPQFELAAEVVPEGGVIIEEAHRELAVLAVLEAISREGLQVLGQAESRISGREGNREIFVLAKRHLAKCLSLES